MPNIVQVRKWAVDWKENLLPNYIANLLVAVTMLALGSLGTFFSDYEFGLRAGTKKAYQEAIELAKADVKKLNEVIIADRVQRDCGLKIEGARLDGFNECVKRGEVGDSLENFYAVLSEKIIEGERALVSGDEQKMRDIADQIVAIRKKGKEALGVYANKVLNGEIDLLEEELKKGAKGNIYGSLKLLGGTLPARGELKNYVIKELNRASGVVK